MKNFKNFKNKKKIKIQGIVHVTTNSNNTIISIADKKGNVKFRTSAGACGFKSTRRRGKHAALIAGIKVARKSSRKGLKVVLVRVSGFGKGKQSSIKGLYKGGLRIIRIEDVTSIPFNGCRVPRAKR